MIRCNSDEKQYVLCAKRYPPEQEVVGSNPAGRTTYHNDPPENLWRVFLYPLKS